MYVVNIVNSFIGRPGNIGERTARILSELRHENIFHKSVSRGMDGEANDFNINMGYAGHIPRILNAYRIYLNMNFNHRIWDIRFFELFCNRNKNFWLEQSSSSTKIAHLWESSPKLINILKQNDFRVVLDVPIAPTTTSRELIRKFGSSVNLHPHDSIEEMERKCFELADSILAPSEFVKNELLKLNISSEKILVIPFGVDIPEIAKTEKSIRNSSKNSGVNFCFAGNVSARKGIQTLLSAWDNPEFKDDTLHLCGRIYPEMSTMLANFNFKNVITPGFVDVFQYFKKCDVYVFPSFLEGSSKSVYQAMACGLPCIVTPNSGSIIRTNIDGIIIEPGDVDALRDAMCQFKNSRHLIEEMGRNGMNFVRDFTWQNYAKSVLNTYKSIKNNKI